MKWPWRKEAFVRRPWTIDRIIEEYPDEGDWMRHMAFCRFVLGESTYNSAYIANHAQGTALNREAMELIIADWQADKSGRWSEDYGNRGGNEASREPNKKTTS